MLFLFILYFIFGIDANIFEWDEGDTFTDHFTVFNRKRWTSNDGLLSCVGKHCVLRSEKNLVFQHLGGVQLKYRSDCSGVECCHGLKLNKDCTKFTSGALVSKHRYGYGSYRWKAYTTEDVSRNNKYKSNYLIPKEVSHSSLQFTISFLFCFIRIIHYKFHFEFRFLEMT